MLNRLIKMADLDLANKRVLVRQDLNVPLKGGQVNSDVRIRAALPTLENLLQQQAAVILMSHLGRPDEGQPQAQYSLAPVADHLARLLGKSVRLETDWLSGVEVKAGEVVLCENVRFNTGEKSNDDDLARQMASLCDVFVMDAFGTAHRAQASTHGVARYAPVSCAGPLLAAELTALSTALDNPARPVVAIVGGAKVSTKLTVLERLSGVVDQLIVGGGIANTFIAATGHGVGKSLQEADLQDTARRLMEEARLRGAAIPMATDVVTGHSFDADTEARTCSVSEVAEDEMILDIGPQTAAEYSSLLERAGTIVWNGPVGVFEFEQFAGGTRVVAEAIANSPAYSIAGGGDTLAAADQFNVAEKISYISTGGGAFLEFLEGRTLPAVAILEERAATENLRVTLHKS